jgi:hypothetical protein
MRTKKALRRFDAAISVDLSRNASEGELKQMNKKISRQVLQRFTSDGHMYEGKWDKNHHVTDSQFN